MEKVVEIIQGIRIVKECLYLEKEKILIISDLHIGQEEALNKQGLLVPRFQLEDIIKEINEIKSKVEFEKVIINGDLKHEFGLISKQEWNDTLKFLDLFENKKIILIKGNHDIILKPLANKKNLAVVDNFKIGDILIIHGDKIINEKEIKDIKIIIIGHEHPAISFPERRTEKYKCFLKGKYKGKTLVVMPSFNFLNEGSDITKESLLSPLIENIDTFEVYVITDEILN